MAFLKFMLMPPVQPMPIVTNGYSTGSGIKDTITYRQGENGLQSISLVVSNACGTDTLRKFVQVHIGMEEIKEKWKWQVFPNPVVNTFHVRING